MRMHESWRDEIGWILAVVGAVLLLLGVIDVFTQVFLITTIPAWPVFVVGLVLLVGGWALHMTRPAGKRDAGEGHQTPSA